jgi:hypothetical protein
MQRASGFGSAESSKFVHMNQMSGLGEGMVTVWR